MNNQEIINKAPKDWTHYADGTYLQFTGIWLRYESGCPEITSCKEWVADINIEDCENIRSRTDIERIVALEQALEEVCYDMECEIENKYRAIRGYASSEANRKRDLYEVESARKVLRGDV